MDNIFERMVWVFKRNIEDLDESVEITEDTMLNELGISSIEMMKLLVYMENEFGIMFDEYTLVDEDFESAGELAQFIRKLVQEKES